MTFQIMNFEFQGNIHVICHYLVFKLQSSKSENKNKLQRNSMVFYKQGKKIKWLLRVLRLVLFCSEIELE